MIILLIVLGLLVGGLAVFWLIGVWLSATNVGFVPASYAVVERMVRLSGIAPGKKAIDLGSGDGRVTMAMARTGAIAEGVELQPLLVWWSRLRVLRMRKVMRPTFSRRDLWSLDLSGFDVVTSYAFPRMMEKLEEKFDRELKPGARVVLYTFPLPHWRPKIVDGKVFVYEKSAA